MDRAIKETNRRRAKQLAYNEEHGITPETVQKAVRDLILVEQAAEEKVAYQIQGKPRLTADEIGARITELEGLMIKAAGNLEFEKAAEHRDEIREWRRLLGEEAGAPAPAQRSQTRFAAAGRRRGRRR